jgi:anti-sigma-K factor RskA
MDDRRRVRAALRAVYGAPAAESIDWWSLRSRILDAAGINGRARKRSLWDRTLWRRALIPVTFAATIVMALAIADTRSDVAPGIASAVASTAAESTEVTAWLRAASAGGSVSQRELDPLPDASAWLGAVLTATSD